jgi:hypothetical protein
LIKVVNLVSVIIAPLVVQYAELGVVGWAVVLVLLGILVWSIRQSKRTADPVTKPATLGGTAGD